MKDKGKNRGIVALIAALGVLTALGFGAGESMAAQTAGVAAGDAAASDRTSEWTQRPDAAGGGEPPSLTNDIAGPATGADRQLLVGLSLFAVGLAALLYGLVLATGGRRGAGGHGRGAALWEQPRGSHIKTHGRP